MKFWKERVLPHNAEGTGRHVDSLELNPSVILSHHQVVIDSGVRFQQSESGCQVDNLFNLLPEWGISC